MRPTEIEFLKKQIVNLKNKLFQVKEVVEEMGKIESAEIKWTRRETIMFNSYTKLKSIVR